MVSTPPDHATTRQLHAPRTAGTDAGRTTEAFYFGLELKVVASAPAKGQKFELLPGEWERRVIGYEP